MAKRRTKYVTAASVIKMQKRRSKNISKKVSAVFYLTFLVALTLWGLGIWAVVRLVKYAA